MPTPEHLIPAIPTLILKPLCYLSHPAQRPCSSLRSGLQHCDLSSPPPPAIFSTQREQQSSTDDGRDLPGNMSQPLPAHNASQGMLVLESWAARKNLGHEVYVLVLNAVYAQAMLHIANGKETENPARDALLLQLQQAVHDAYALLNELHYFRVQDELDVPPKGCINHLHFHARHAARAAAAKLKLSSSSSSRDNAKFIEKLASVGLSSLDCCVGNEFRFRQVQDVKAPKPKFSRVVLYINKNDKHS